MAAHSTDVTGAKAVLNTVERQITLRLLKIWADNGHQGDWPEWLDEQ